MNVRSLGVGVAAMAAAAGAAETHIATIEVIKYVGTICGAVYGVGSVTRLVLSAWREWKAHQLESLKSTIRTELNKKLGKLPCMQDTPIPCSVEVEGD